MRLFRAEQVREFDRVAIENYHVPGMVLMENAGSGAARYLQQKLPPPAQSAPIAVFAGPGNNGGDGYVIARHLRNAGYTVWTFLCTDPTKITGDAQSNLTILQSMTTDIFPCLQAHDWDIWKDRIAQSQAIVDALLGTGLRKDVEGWLQQLIVHLNTLSRPYKMAVDIPSGLDANTGLPRPVCFRADLTTTFAVAKIGLILPSAVPFVGELVVVDIGMPAVIATQTPEVAVLQDEESLRSLWPWHPYDSHKGTYGHVLVLAGSPGKIGAALLSCLAALRTGVGLCTLANEDGVLRAVEGRVLEVMLHRLPPLDLSSALAIALSGATSASKSRTDHTSFPFSVSPGAAAESLPQTVASADLVTHAVEQTLLAAADKSALVIGPGLGQSDTRSRWLQGVLSQCKHPVLLDADALNLLQHHTELLKQRPGPTVLTPHPGEMGRLLGISSQDVQRRRLEVAQELATSCQVTVVLKGARTKVVSPTGQVWINSTGHSGLSTAGSGDVLSGMIGALLARRMEPTLAARMGVYLHGKAADQLRPTLGQSGLIASDLLAQLPHTLALWESV